MTTLEINATADRLDKVLQSFSNEVALRKDLPIKTARLEPLFSPSLAGSGRTGN